MLSARKLLFLAWLPLLSLLLTAPGSAAGLTVSETVVAGGPSDFLEARHLVLTGSNFEIGKKLAEIARDRYGLKLRADAPDRRTRAQRIYMQRNFPVFLERMRGVAAAFDLDLNEDRADVDSLSYLLGGLPGCSVVFYPPSFTRDGVGYLARNYDFTTGTITGARPAPGQLPCTARPYIMELHPDEGYSSLYLCSYDLLGGTLDGINEHGLTVALLADDELNRQFKMEPTRAAQTGLDVVQTLRLLLDTCKDVEEAKVALMLNKQYYGFIPCHYIVADRHGKSFVWEYSQAHNKEYIVEGEDRPQITTNFSLHRYGDKKRLPEEGHRLGSFNRYRALNARIEKTKGTVDKNVAFETNACVAADVPSRSGGRPLGRTLWHAVYCPEQRSLDIDFYLGEEVRPDGSRKIRRSDRLSFVLSSNP